MQKVHHDILSKAVDISDQIKNQIWSVAANHFEAGPIEEFILKFQSLVGSEEIIGSIVQISTDEGYELEVGFFTDRQIVDVTLSKGKVYFYSYPITEIKNVSMVDAGHKWTLTILGEKKFDYNVVKPGLVMALTNYEKSLQAQLAANSIDQFLERS